MNQIETHPYFQRESLVKFCHKHGICVTAHTPLGGAVANTEWFGSVSCLDDPILKVRWNLNLQVIIHLQSFDRKQAIDLWDVYGLLSLPMLCQGIAEKYKKTVGQIVLRWGIQRNTVVIPKTSKLERLRQNLKVFDFELAKEDMELIKSLDWNYRIYQRATYCGVDQ